MCGSDSRSILVALLDEFSAEHDAFRHGGGINKTGMEILRSIRSRPADEADLVDALNIGSTTVRRKFRDLEDLEFITPDQDGLWILTGLGLEELAEATGTLGKGKRQRIRHDLERESYRQRFADPSRQLRPLKKRKRPHRMKAPRNP